MIVGNEDISDYLGRGKAMSNLPRKDWMRGIGVGAAVGLGAGVAVGNYLAGLALGLGIALAVSLRSAFSAG